MKRLLILAIFAGTTFMGTAAPAQAIANCSRWKDAFTGHALCTGPGAYRYHVVVRCVAPSGAVTYENGPEVGKNTVSSRTCNNGVASWTNAVVTNF